jgi:hypothetical protein
MQLRSSPVTMLEMAPLNTDRTDPGVARWREISGTSGIMLSVHQTLWVTCGVGTFVVISRSKTSTRLNAVNQYDSFIVNFALPQRYGLKPLSARELVVHGTFAASYCTGLGECCRVLTFTSETSHSGLPRIFPLTPLDFLYFDTSPRRYQFTNCEL